jgi:hypothetical protein
MSKVAAKFRPGPAGARDRARSELAAVKASIAELEGQRKPLLVAEDGIARVRELDRKIAEHRDTAVVLADRIRALGGEVRRTELARLEQERAAAIDNVIAPAMAKIAALAADMELAVTAMSEKFAALSRARDDLFNQWPAAAPRSPYFRSFSIDDVRHRIVGAMRYAGESGEVEGIPELVKTYGGRRDTIAESMKALMAAFIEAVRSVPIELPPDDEADDGATKNASQNIIENITPAAPEPPPRGVAQLATS